MIRVLLVHGNPLFRAGLRSVLERYQDIEIVQERELVVGQAVASSPLIELIAATQPVVLFDGTLTFSHPDLSAVEAVGQMRRAGAGGILVFAPSLDEEALFRFLVAGAAAIEPPTLSVGDLLEKTRRIAAGEYLISRASLCLTCPPAPRLQQSRSCVTPRERTILRQIMQGQANKQIARALGVSPQTVKNHITSVLKKLHVHDRTAAIVLSLRLGLISLDDAEPDDDLILDQDRGDHESGVDNAFVAMQGPHECLQEV